MPDLQQFSCPGWKNGHGGTRKLWNFMRDYRYRPLILIINHDPLLEIFDVQAIGEKL